MFRLFKLKYNKLSCRYSQIQTESDRVKDRKVYRQKDRQVKETRMALTEKQIDRDVEP